MGKGGTDGTMQPRRKTVVGLRTHPKWRHIRANAHTVYQPNRRREWRAATQHKGVPRRLAYYFKPVPIALYACAGGIVSLPAQGSRIYEVYLKVFVTPLVHHGTY